LAYHSEQLFRFTKKRLGVIHYILTFQFPVLRQQFLKGVLSFSCLCRALKKKKRMRVEVFFYYFGKLNAYPQRDEDSVYRRGALPMELLPFAQMDELKSIDKAVTKGWGE
jgi:hypothetical protein